MDELKKKTEAMLRAVLISSPRGIPLRRLDREYTSITFSSLPFKKLGFNNLEDYLRSIPHVVCFTRDGDGELVLKGVASEADQHVAKLISKQKKPKLRKSAPARKPAARSRPVTSFRTPTRPNTRPITRTVTIARSPSARTKPTSGNVSSTVFGSNYEIPPRMRKVLQQGHNAKTSHNLSRVVTVVPSSMEKDSAKKQLSESKEMTKGFRTPETKTQNTSGQQKESSALNTGPVIKRTIKTRKGGGKFQDMVVYLSKDDAQSALKAHAPSKAKLEVGTDHLSGDKEKIMFSRITQILEEKPRGLWGTRLPIEYKNKFDEELPDGILERIKHLPHVAHFEMPMASRVLLYPPKVQSEPAAVEETQKGLKSSDETNGDFESFELKMLPAPEPGSTVGAYISHIDDVSNFFVHLKERATEVDDLQQRLNEYFQNSSLSSGLIENIRVGLLCCAQFTDDSWNRARIINCIEDADRQTAEVVYLDFGNKEHVPKERLRKLNKKHADLPMMSVKCSLEGVEPVNMEEWNKKSIEKFRELTDGELMMSVIDAHSKDDKLFVQVTNESGQDVGSMLINEGYAARTCDLQSTHSSSSSSLASQPRESPPEADQTKPRFRPRFLSSKSQEEKKEIGYAEMPADEFVDVFIFNIVSTDGIYAHVCADDYSDKLTLLEKSMLCYFADSQEKPPKVMVGYLYALFSKEVHPDTDGMWYRVKVLSLNDGEAKVEFVDYRETTRVPESDLRDIPTRFLDLPFQAFILMLNGIPKSKNPEVIEKLKSMALGKLLVAEKIKKIHDTVYVELYDTSTAADININALVRELIIPDEDLKPALPKPGEQIDVYVTHISASGQVFVQVPGAGVTRLEELMNDITEHYSKATKAAEFVKTPYVGKICCAKCSDGNWYRARITELLDRKVVVEYVDYGNTETISSASLREPTKANEHVSSLPFQAIECQLFGVRKEVWSEDLVDKLTEAGITDGTLSLEVVKPGDIPVVNLFFCGEEEDAFRPSIVNLMFEVTSKVEGSEGKLERPKSVEERAENGSAGSVDGSEESRSVHEDDSFLDGFTAELELPQTWFDVTVTDINNPTHFTFQPLERLSSLEDMTEKMNTFYQNTKKSPFKDLRAGVVCAAYHSEHTTWYRAVVKAVLSSTQVCVRFIDYGDMKITQTSYLQPLKDEFKNLPFLGVQGSLFGIVPCDDSEQWSDDCLRRFEELTVDKMLVARIKDGTCRYVYGEERKIQVELFDTSSDDKDVSLSDVLVIEGFAKKSEILLDQ